MQNLTLNKQKNHKTQMKSVWMNEITHLLYPWIAKPIMKTKKRKIGIYTSHEKKTKQKQVIDVM